MILGLRHFFYKNKKIIFGSLALGLSFLFLSTAIALALIFTGILVAPILSAILIGIGIGIIVGAINYAVASWFTSKNGDSQVAGAKPLSQPVAVEYKLVSGGALQGLNMPLPNYEGFIASLQQHFSADGAAEQSVATTVKGLPVNTEGNRVIVSNTEGNIVIQDQFISRMINEIETGISDIMPDINELAVNLYAKAARVSELSAANRLELRCFDDTVHEIMIRYYDYLFDEDGNLKPEIANCVLEFLQRAPQNIQLPPEGTQEREKLLKSIGIGLFNTSVFYILSANKSEEYKVLYRLLQEYVGFIVSNNTVMPDKKAFKDQLQVYSEFLRGKKNSNMPTSLTAGTKGQIVLYYEGEWDGITVPESLKQYFSPVLADVSSSQHPVLGQ